MSKRTQGRRRSNLRQARLLVEPFEPRVLLSTFDVTDTNDHGLGSSGRRFLIPTTIPRRPDRRIESISRSDPALR